MSGLTRSTDPNVLVGSETADDAGVYRLSDDLALIQTVDVITPVVDDPWTFGAVAAANALSDVYAMGGRPITALNVVCFPKSCLPLEVLAEILAGAADKLAEAGAALLGGHTLQDNEPKYGLAVTGVVEPDRFWRNAGAHIGDRILLTKPLGVGIITTAAKNDRAAEDVLARAVASMTTLNRRACELARDCTIHACTDITGFGLLGHLREVADGTGLTVRLRASSVPVLEGARALAEEDLFPGGAYRSREALEGKVLWPEDLDEPGRLLLCDPQTSGGLALCVAPDEAEDLLRRLRDAGLPAEEVGDIGPRGPYAIEVLR